MKTGIYTGCLVALSSTAVVLKLLSSRGSPDRPITCRPSELSGLRNRGHRNEFEAVLNNGPAVYVLEPPSDPSALPFALPEPLMLLRTINHQTDGAAANDLVTGHRASSGQLTAGNC